MSALAAALMIPIVGCTTLATVLDAAQAGLVAYEAIVPQGSDQYQLADKIDTELANLNILYGDAQAASTSAEPGVAAQIAAQVQVLTSDSAQFLALVAVKNPEKQLIARAIIASVDAFIAGVQNAHPDPSGNSAQLNSTTAQMKAAVKISGCGIGCQVGNAVGNAFSQRR